MSGVSGAGRKVEDRLLFGNVDGNVAAYGSVEHRHVPEMERGLRSSLGLLASAEAIRLPNSASRSRLISCPSHAASLQRCVRVS